MSIFLIRFAEALETLGEEKCISLLKAIAFLNFTRAFSALTFFCLHCFLKTKKGEIEFFGLQSFYGRFLSSSIASTTPIMTITTIIPIVAYAMPFPIADKLSGDAVGAGVAGAALA